MSEMQERIRGLNNNAKNASVAFKGTANTNAFRKFHRQPTQKALNMIETARKTITTDTSRPAIKLMPREFYDQRAQSLEPESSFVRNQSTESSQSLLKQQDTLVRAEYMDHVSEIDSEFFSGENSPTHTRRRSTAKKTTPNKTTPYQTTPYQSRKKSTVKKKKTPYSNQKSTPFSNKNSSPQLVSSFNASFDAPQRKASNGWML